MIDDANNKGADEIIGVRVEISEISNRNHDGMLVCSVTGTAVKLIQKKGGKKKIDFNVRNKKTVTKNNTSNKNVNSRKRRGVKRT